MNAIRPVFLLCAVVALVGLTGCGLHRRRPPTVGLTPSPPIPIDQAGGIVNRNIAKITGTLRATGSVDGHFTTDAGRTISYSVDGVLFYLAPGYVRFDLKKLGDRQFLFGSNEAMWWIYSKEDETHYCGRHDDPSGLPPDIPIRPEQIPAILGLLRVEPVECVQRVVEEHQQILFITTNAGTGATIEKEYWVDRFPPHLIRRVVFRDAIGAVEMTSDLDEYEPVGAQSADGPWLPRVMTAEWPRKPGRGDAHMRFRVSKWELVPQVGPTGPQFETPPECAGDPGA